MEYSRKVPLMANGIALEGSAAGERQLDFGSVHIEEKVDKKETKLINVSLLSTSTCTTVLMLPVNCKWGSEGGDLCRGERVVHLVHGTTEILGVTATLRHCLDWSDDLREVFRVYTNAGGSNAATARPGISSQTSHR